MILDSVTFFHDDAFRHSYAGILKTQAGNVDLLIETKHALILDSRVAFSPMARLFSPFSSLSPFFFSLFPFSFFTRSSRPMQRQIKRGRIGSWSNIEKSISR